MVQTPDYQRLGVDIYPWCKHQVIRGLVWIYTHGANTRLSEAWCGYIPVVQIPDYQRLGVDIYPWCKYQIIRGLVRIYTRGANTRLSEAWCAELHNCMDLKDPMEKGVVYRLWNWICRRYVLQACDGSRATKLGYSRDDHI